MDIQKTFKKLKNIEWTEEQKNLILESFNALDKLLLSCVEEGDNNKYREIISVHKTMHDISIVSALKDIVKENIDEILPL